MDDAYRFIMGENAPAWRKKPPALDCGTILCRASLLPPPGEADITTRAGMALARLKTLSKKTHCGCPDDERVKRALWLCLGAVAFPGDARRTRARIAEAAEAALCLTHGAAPREREALRARCAQPADAMARLLSLALKRQNDKEERIC